MDDWRTIDSAPKDGTAVLVYFARLNFGADLGRLRNHVEHVALGWYEDGTWYEAGTAHDMFESWREAEQLPTHWMPLPAPPGSDHDGSR